MPKSKSKRVTAKKTVKKPSEFSVAQTMQILKSAEAQGLKTVLHVGCGQKRQDGMPSNFRDPAKWKEIRLDISESVKPDIVADIMDMKPVPDNSVDALYSSHNVEHVYPHQVQSVLQQFHRVLKPGGLAVITLPDMQAVAFYVAEGKLEHPLYQSPIGPITPLDIMYGHVPSVSKGQHYMAHKTAFTAETLGRRMVLAGFSGVNVRRDDGYNLWAYGYKIAKNDPKYSDDIHIQGRYKQTVVALPDPHSHDRQDNLDAEPQRWESPGLKKA